MEDDILSSALFKGGKEIEKGEREGKGEGEKRERKSRSMKKKKPKKNVHKRVRPF